MVGLALKNGPIPTDECTIQADVIVIVAHGAEAKVSALRSCRFSRRGRPRPTHLGDYPNSRYAYNSRDQSERRRVQRQFYGSTRASGEAAARDANRSVSSSFSMMAVYGMGRPPCWPGSSRSAHGSGWYASGALYRLSEKSPSGNGAPA